MTHEQKRLELLNGVPRWYSGVAHLLLMHAMSFCIIGLCVWQLDAPRWWELSFIPGFFVFANFFEYYVHKGPLHHRTRGMGILFDRHTLTHHAYFHQDTMRVHNLREFRFVIFPPPFLPLALVATAPIPIALWFVSPNLAILFVLSATAYYLVYEWFHTWHHLFPDTAVAAHHMAHHDPSQMTSANFNVSFPLADLVLGTRVVGRRK